MENKDFNRNWIPSLKKIVQRIVQIHYYFIYQGHYDPGFGFKVFMGEFTIDDEVLGLRVIVPDTERRQFIAENEPQKIASTAPALIHLFCTSK